MSHTVIDVNVIMQQHAGVMPNLLTVTVRSLHSDRMRHHGVYGDYWQSNYFQTARKIVGKGAHSSNVVQPATNIAGLQTSLQTTVFSYSVVERV